MACNGLSRPSDPRVGHTVQRPRTNEQTGTGVAPIPVSLKRRIQTSPPVERDVGAGELADAQTAWAKTSTMATSRAGRVERLVLPPLDEPQIGRFVVAPHRGAVPNLEVERVDSVHRASATPPLESR
jgi:hypothetical protein